MFCYETFKNQYDNNTWSQPESLHKRKFLPCLVLVTSYSYIFGHRFKAFPVCKYHVYPFNWQPSIIISSQLFQELLVAMEKCVALALTVHSRCRNDRLVCSRLHDIPTVNQNGFLFQLTKPMIWFKHLRRRHRKSRNIFIKIIAVCLWCILFW